MPHVPVGSQLEKDLLALAQQRGAVVIGGPPIEPPILRGTPPTFTDEGAFQAAIVEQARKWGWLVFHVYDSRRCEPGFPDLLMIRRDRMIVAELKRSRKEKPSPDQRKWLRAFQGLSSANVYVWSPEDWPYILEMLA